MSESQSPQFLYRYYKLDPHFYESIDQGYVWYSSPTSLNDPFDCHIYLESKATKEQYETFLKECTNVRKLNRESIRRIAKDMFTKPKDRERIFNEVAADSISKNGICCFTEKNDNILMWSHYTNCHEGVCLKYDIDKMLTQKTYTLKVDYSQNYPTYNAVLDKGGNEVFTKKMLGTKSCDWEYENEYRLLSVTQGKNPINRLAVVEVIFGCKCKDSKALKSKFNSQGYQPAFFNARLKEKMFGLDIVKC